jgi:hypothetical protein
MVFQRRPGSTPLSERDIDYSLPIERVRHESARPAQTFPARPVRNRINAAPHESRVDAKCLSMATELLQIAGVLPKHERTARRSGESPFRPPERVSVAPLLIVGQADSGEEPMGVRLPPQRSPYEAARSRPIIRGDTLLDGVRHATLHGFILGAA